MRGFIITQGEYSDRAVKGITETQEMAVVLAESLGPFTPIEVMLWENEIHYATWEYQRGGFVDGVLNLIWEKK